MKKIDNKLFILIVMAVLFGACKKEFLDTFPSNSVSAADAVKSTKNALIALNGIHRILYTQYDGQPQSGEGSAMIIRDLMGEDEIYTRSNGRFDFVGHIRYIDHRNVNSANTRYVYRFYYRVISNANVLIAGIDGAEGPDAEKKFIKGQALAYRAWAHFNLVQLWGERFAAGSPNAALGVPLLTEPTREAQARSTVAQVYEQVNKDLDEAIVLLEGFNRGSYSGDLATSKAHINKSVAQGFKSRVALAQQNFAVAADMANKAKAGFPLMPASAYDDGFNDATNVEWMWATHQIADHNTFFYSFFASMGANFNGSNIRTQPKAINSALYNALPATDIRKAVFSRTGSDVPIPPGGARVAYHAMKFLAASSSLSIGDVPMMRAAEMYLNEAEALARQNKDVEAQDVLFALISKRDPAYTKSTKTGAELIDEVLFHRRVELWGEGFRFTDLKRMNAPLDRTKAPNTNMTVSVVEKIPAGDKLWIWLFPQDELNANKLVEQNPL